MSEPSLFRLYLLRAMYLLMVVGLAATVWPGLLRNPGEWPLMNGVVSAMLAAVSILALIGLRYPLAMIPLLLFELLWKIIWLLVVALPLWRAGTLGPDKMQTVIDCIPVILIPLVLPWRYVLERFVTGPGERWRGRADGLNS